MFTTQTLIWHGNRVGHTYTLINANNIDLPPKKTNKSRDELNIVFVRKSWLISQHGSQNLKTCNLKKWTTKINVHRRYNSTVFKHCLLRYIMSLIICVVISRTINGVNFRLPWLFFFYLQLPNIWQTWTLLFHISDVVVY